MRVCLLGSPGTLNQKGRVDLYFSGNSRFPTVDPSVVIEGESLDGFGEALSLADFNDDGLTDLAVGSSRYDSGRGRVWIFNGQTLCWTRLWRERP